MAKIRASLGGSGGSNVYTETFTLSSDGEQKVINTGISNLSHVCIFGVGQNAYDTQVFLHWNSDMGQTFYGGGCYATSLGASYKAHAFSNTAENQTPVIVSITNGTVEILNIKQTQWNPQAYTFYAW